MLTEHLVPGTEGRAKLALMELPVQSGETSNTHMQACTHAHMRTHTMQVVITAVKDKEL